MTDDTSGTGAVDRPVEHDNSVNTTLASTALMSLEGGVSWFGECG